MAGIGDVEIKKIWLVKAIDELLQIDRFFAQSIFEEANSPIEEASDFSGS
jgi:hypothetical protein